MHAGLLQYDFQYEDEFRCSDTSIDTTKVSAKNSSFGCFNTV